MAKRYQTNQKLIHIYGILFQNIKFQGELLEVLQGYGYDEAEINKGEALYNKVLEEYQKNIRKKQEEVSAYSKFKRQYEKVSLIFSEDRQKIRIIFKGEDSVLKLLRITGVLNKAISTRLDDMFVMYSTINKEEDIKQKVNKLRITPEHIQEQITLVEEVRNLYGDYTRKKGDSQQATKDKDLAFAEIDKWVRELYSIGKIALKDRPQLLESLGKVVKN